MAPKVPFLEELWQYLRFRGVCANLTVLGKVIADLVEQESLMNKNYSETVELLHCWDGKNFEHHFCSFEVGGGAFQLRYPLDSLCVDPSGRSL